MTSHDSRNWKLLLYFSKKFGCKTKVTAQWKFHLGLKSSLISDFSAVAVFNCNIFLFGQALLGTSAGHCIRRPAPQQPACRGSGPATHTTRGTTTTSRYVNSVTNTWTSKRTKEISRHADHLEVGKKCTEVRVRNQLRRDDKAHKQGSPPWFWNPEETSLEVQNRGISGPIKRI